MKDVPIVSAATGYTSYNGRNYILIFNEAIFIEGMDHILINPNQCRYHGLDVKDNPYDPNEPMMISTNDQQFTVCLQSEGTVVYFDTWLPKRRDLEDYPHIELTSRTHWNPHLVEFTKTKRVVQEELEGRNVNKIKR